MCSITLGCLFVFKLNSAPWVEEPEEEILFCGTIVENATEEYLGAVLFQEKCSSCHSVFKDLTGPALGFLHENPFWTDSKKLARYLRELKAFRKEKYIRGLRAKYGTGPHIVFPGITDQEVNDIYAYVTGYAR